MIEWPGLLLPIWLLFLCPPKKNNLDNQTKPKKIIEIKKKDYFETPCQIIEGECKTHNHKN